MSSLSLSSILTHANLTMYHTGSLESSQQHPAASTLLPSIDTLHMPSLSYTVMGQWYKQINPQSWSERNVLDWISDHIENTKFDASTLSVAHCAMDGPTLCQMSYEQILAIFGTQLGSHLHQSLLDLKIKYELQSLHSLSGTDLNDEACQLLDSFLENLDLPLGSLSANFPRLSTVKVHEVDNIKREFEYETALDLSHLAMTPLDMDYPSDSEYSSSSTGGDRGVFSFHTPSSPESRSSSDSDPEFSYPQIAKVHIKTEKGDLRTKRPRGRPPKVERHHGNNYFSHPRKSKHVPRGTHLWEFIRDILIHPERNQGMMKWEDRREGVFKFLKSEAVAQMWGQKKKNSSMTYEKLSRAMRYYYKREILERVDGRRLVYKFGKNSSGWKTEEIGM